jgi:hypothetical protein
MRLLFSFLLWKILDPYRFGSIFTRYFIEVYGSWIGRKLLVLLNAPNLPKMDRVFLGCPTTCKKSAKKRSQKMPKMTLVLDF